MDARWTFFSVDVEISNRCDVGCMMCPRSKLARDRGIMTRETFAGVARALLPLKSRVTLSGMGNPLANPLWPEFVEEYKKKGGKIGLVVHGSHLSKEVLDTLERVQPNFLEISFPSVDENHFSSLCPNSDYRMAHRAIVSLLSNSFRRFPIVVVGTRTGLNPDEETAASRHWEQHGLASRVFPCHSRGGSLEDASLVDSPIKTPVFQKCGLIGLHSFVTWQGKLLSCCHDMTGETEIGNLTNDEPETLMEKKSALLEEVNPFSMCIRCDDPYRMIEPPKGPFPESARKRRRVLHNLGKN